MFVWGLNDKDQLGGLKGSKVNADRSFGLTMEFYIIWKEPRFLFWLYCRDERFHIPEVKNLLILFTISLFIQYTFNEIKQYCQIKSLQIHYKFTKTIIASCERT